jgi:hypothetical protein
MDIISMELQFKKNNYFKSSIRRRPNNSLNEINFKGGHLNQ